MGRKFLVHVRTGCGTSSSDYSFRANPALGKIWIYTDQMRTRPEMVGELYVPRKKGVGEPSHGKSLSCHHGDPVMAKYYHPNRTNHDARCTNVGQCVKSSQNKTASVSLKKEWKPSFEWQGNNLVLNAVEEKDVFALDPSAKVKPLSKLQLLTDFAKKFGLIVKNKDDSYSLGPNLEFTLPQTTYTLTTEPKQTNQRYQWLGDHFVGVTPRDLLGGTPLLKVTLEDGVSYVHLSRMVAWTIKNIDAMFNDQVGEVHQTAMVYCDAFEPTVVGSQTHALLRTVELKRSGEGRRDIEPIHREWLPIRNTVIESIEVSIATTSGDLLELSPGKTLLTLGFQKV